MKYTEEQIRSNRKRWIEALRSGKYFQGVGFLHSIEMGAHYYCCLGVACEIFRNEFDIPVIFDENRNMYYYDGKECYISYPLEKYLGLNCEYAEELMLMNDTSRKSFIEIADHIETLPIDRRPVHD